MLDFTIKKTTGLAARKSHVLEAEEKLRNAGQSKPSAIEVIGYASPGQVEILRKIPRTGGMKVKGRKDNRYTEPIVLLSAARSAVLSAVIRCEQAGAFKMCMECGYQDGHDEICKFHAGNRAAQGAGVLEGWQRVPVGEMISNDGDIYWADRHPPMGTKLYTAPIAAPAQPAAHHIEQALDMVTPAKSEVQRLREALTQLLSYAERQICAHDNTHRGGAIWEICDDCGAKWADDEGGKPEFKWPNEIEAARAALAASTGQEVE